ncbi:hypothetical protein [Allosalinactinospora lopnorensis]|uniref:hypothetical protein n=1 Tax=Allosalinactinospora lopnorensis TaxID=1352348 RepID=UPI000698C8D1|nr:hypothetical protein [Allosalinactinospora lopnorensis]
MLSQLPFEVLPLAGGHGPAPTERRRVLFGGYGSPGPGQEVGLPGPLALLRFAQQPGEHGESGPAQ